MKLSYTKIVAPAAGIVLKRSAEVGERINAGQQLLMIAQIGDIWVTANFKETQMRNIHPGQSARIHVDALREDFEGYVETIGGGTGAIAACCLLKTRPETTSRWCSASPCACASSPIRMGSIACAPACPWNPKFASGR